MKLSVIIPCMNEEGNIENLYFSLTKVLKDIKYELLFIDDGSVDKTLKILKQLNKKDKHVKIISFSRNFKKEAAIYAGISKSIGEYTCIIDGDMQQNPIYLIKMLSFLDQNKEYDQVAMIMKKRKNETFIAKTLKKAFYKVIDLISDIHFEPGASDFRMFNKNVKNAVMSISENNRFSKGIFSWVGFNTKFMTYEVEKRKSGKTKFSLKTNLSYALDGILGFSTKPLRLATYTGILTSIAAFIYLVYIIIKTIILGTDVPGFASLMCIILLLGGIQLITIGILGEYLAKNYLETKKRPIYITKEEIGFLIKTNTPKAEIKPITPLK